MKPVTTLRSRIDRSASQPAANRPCYGDRVCRRGWLDAVGGSKDTEQHERYRQSEGAGYAWGQAWLAGGAR